MADDTTTVAKPTAHEARVEQLTQDGLIDYYRPARSFKRELFAAVDVAPPPPLLAGFRCKREFFERHDSLGGRLPASGVFELENCYFGKAGTLLDRERKVLYDDDLVSAYWMWFLGKVIRRGAIENFPPDRDKTIMRFIAGEDGPSRRIDGGGATVVSLAKPGTGVYGHWILDVLPMAFNFFQAVETGAIEGPFKFLISEHVHGWARGFLQTAFGIGPDDLITFDDDTEIAAVDRVIVPSQLRVSPLISPRMNDYVDFLFERLGIADVPADDLPRRIYLKRAKPRKRGSPDLRMMHNEDEVEQAIVDGGLTPVSPETMPWPQQIKLFAEAEIVAGEYGSAMHNTVFAPSSTVNLVLANRNSNWNQSAIAGLRRQRMICVKPLSEEKLGIANQIAYRHDVNLVREAVALAHEHADANS